MFLSRRLLCAHSYRYGLRVPGVTRYLSSLRNENTVFVHNVAKTTTREAIIYHLSLAGQVIDCELISNTDDKHPNFAKVEYRSPQDAAVALTHLNQTGLDGRRILVSPSETIMEQRKEQTEFGKTVFVHNLPFHIDEDNLRGFMEEAGEVVSCNIRKDSYGESKGSAVVAYADPAHAEWAVENLNLLRLGGRDIFVQKDQKPPVPPVLSKAKTTRKLRLRNVIRGSWRKSKRPTAA